MAAPPIYLTINMPATPTGSNGKATPKKKKANKHKAHKRKHSRKHHRKHHRNHRR
jgi:hypothetical protein